MTHRTHGLLPDKGSSGDDIHPLTQGALTQGALTHPLFHCTGAATDTAAISIVLSHGIGIWSQGACMSHKHCSSCC